MKICRPLSSVSSVYSVALLFSVLSAASVAPVAAQQAVQVRIDSGDGMPLNILPPGRTPKTGTSAMRGRIVAGDTGSPVRRAQVRISGPDIGTKSALTDNQGRYEFKDLPAGRFNLSVSKSGYVTMQYGQTRPFEPGKAIDLVDAQVMEKLDVALPRGGVLAGRVVDETGEAVAEADVVAMRMQFQNGKRRLVPTGRNSTTNDLGQFRLYGLPPGDYYVSANLRSISSALDLAGLVKSGDAGSNQASGYASTYYPGTPNPGEAQRVTLAVGQELPSVDIQLQPVRLARITGTALGSDGKPMSGGMVMLMPSMKDAAMMILPGSTSRTDKDGNFTLNGVTPGDYLLQVQSSAGGVFQTSAGGNLMMFNLRTDDASASQNASPSQREFGVASVSVTGDDVTGLVITGTRGAKASGTLKFTGPPPDGAANVRISAPATDAENNPMPTFGTANVKDGGTFEIDSLVGGHIFRAANLPKGWMLKSVRFNGEDVTDRGIDFRPGEDVSGIEVELNSATQTVTGTVASDTNEPVKDYTVVFFPEDQQRWALAQNRWLASGRPDQDGRYRVTSLPPGRYYAIAVDYVAQGEWQDPEWLARAAKKATSFTLEDGANKTLDLKLAGS